MKNCKQCGQAIGNDKRRDSVFCSNSCKAKYHELRAENNDYDGVLAGHRSETIPRPEQFEKPKDIVIKTEELEPFRNVLGGPETLPQTIQANKGEMLPLPEPQITKQLSVPNPKYEIAKKRMAELKDCVQKNLNEIKRLNDQIQYEKGRDGTGIYLTGGLTGAALGYFVMDDIKPKKKNKSLEDNTKQVLGSIVLGLVGLYVGNAINEQNQPVREKEKAANIKKCQQQILSIENYLNTLKPTEVALTLELAKEPAFFYQQQSLPNPYYMMVINHNANINSENPEGKKLILNIEGLKGVVGEHTKPKNPLETDKILSAKNMASQQIPILDFRGKWLDFIGQPQTNFFLVVHGMSGEGKTHFTIQMAKYLAEKFGNVLYVSGEEGFAPTMQKKIQDMGAMVPKLFVGDFRSGEELLKEVPNKYHFIIIDSTNNMDIQPEQMKAIRQRFKESGFIAVCQSTKDDKIRGSYQIVHDSDITVKVNDGIAVTTKNRFKQKGTQYDIFAAYKKPITKVIQMKPNDKLDEDFRNTL